MVAGTIQSTAKKFVWSPVRSPYLNVNVFSTKVLIEDTILTSPTILRGHPSQAKVSPVAGQRENLHFSVTLRP